MDLVTFLHQEPNLTNPPLCFTSTQQIPFLFSLIQKKLRGHFDSLVHIDTIESESALKALLEISFLDTKTFYWLSEEIITKYPFLTKYLLTYKGPHTIGFFSSKPPNINPIIQIPLQLDINSYQHLFAFMYPTPAKKKETITQKVFDLYKTIPFSGAFLLMHYTQLIGNKSETFIQEWLPSIIQPEKSLFNLSGYFFAKKTSLFFEQWQLIESDYSELFWITYWSEQLFKAYAYIQLQKAQQLRAAKQIAYRLPFSFIQKDWKNLSLMELKKAHNHIYTLDWNIKNGLSGNFEHFYSQFFLNRL